ncbi:MAG: hypothetical protein ACJ786_07655 [Catenulispora sp.]
MIRLLWGQWNEWALTELPRLNREILSGAPLEALIAGFRRNVLEELPEPESFSRQDARRVLVVLGLAGSSVARHYQEADLSRKARPQESFDRLRAGPHGLPFLAYFAAVAEASGAGHGDRDTYASLVRWNAPTTEVRMDGRVAALIPGCFPDLRIRTYTADPGEISFFALLKKSEAFELAVNEALEPMAAETIDILAPEAAVRVSDATRLMRALIHLNQSFAAVPPEQGGLKTDYFMDVFRQFAVHWRPADLPPTGAADPEFLRRDFLLGIDFPGYADHVHHVFPALLAAERVMLDGCMRRRPLGPSLLAALGLDPGDLAATGSQALRATVRAHPELAGWYLLLAANARFSAVHLQLTEKFLFRPQRVRDRSGLGDRPLVSNRRGTTGMEPPLLVRLTRARSRHALRALGRIPDDELAAACGMTAEASDAEGGPTVRFIRPSGIQPSG